MTDLELIARIEKILNVTLILVEKVKWDSKGFVLDKNNKVISLGLYRCDAKSIKSVLPILKYLSEMRTLFLGDNQIDDISFVEDLPKLQILELAANKISDISFVKSLAWLHRLNLNKNKVNDISALAHLTQLSTLLIWGNLITDVSSLKRLKNLNNIQIDRNLIEVLPRWITHFGLNILYDNGEGDGEIHLGDNPIKTPPLEVVEQGNAAIKNYFDQLKNQGKDTIYEAKLMLVGQPGAGKTTLLNKLFDPDYPVPNPVEQSTLGIDVRQNWPFNNAEEKDCKAHVWDFGGQQIQYMLHQFFLTTDCVYVLMAEKRRELANFDYWLNVINLLGQNSPVVILFNEINIDSVSSFIFDEKKYQELFSKLDMQTLDVNFANMEDGRFDILTKTIKGKLCNLGHMGKEVPARWVDIRNELENRRGKKHIRINEYFEICAHFKVSQEPDQMLILQYFHLLGIVLYFRDDDNLCDTLFLDPNWTVDAVYSVLADKEIEKSNGFIDKSAIDTIWQQKGYDFEERAKLLLLMLKDNFELCYKVPSDANLYIVPSLLSPKRPVYQWVGTGNLQFRFQYPFMPKGIISRLIVRMHRYVDQDKLWQQGAVFRKDDALVEVTEQKTVKEGLKIIAIRVAAGSAAKRKDLLTLIREDIRVIQDGSFPSLPCLEMVPCCCCECAVAQTPYFFDYQVLEKFMHKGKNQILCHESTEVVDIADLVGCVYSAQELESKSQTKSR